MPNESGQKCEFWWIVYLEQVGAACINIRLANPGDTTSDYEEACDPSPYFDQEQNTSAAFPPR